MCNILETAEQMSKHKYDKDKVRTNFTLYLSLNLSAILSRQTLF